MLNDGYRGIHRFCLIENECGIIRLVIERRLIMIKLFISDLDGTYLNGLHVSSKYAEETVQEVLKQQKEFAIATGRHLHKNHQVGIGFFNAPIYKIAMNGAIIWNKAHQVIYEKAIDTQFIQLLLAQFPDISFELITKTGVYIPKSRFQHITSVLKNRLSVKAIVKYALALWTKDYHFKVDALALNNVLMVACRIGHEGRAQAVKEFIRQNHSVVTDYGPNVYNFEVVACGVNKQTAASWLAKHLSVFEEEVAVYGNDLNDVPMLAHFKHSYVPSSAVDAAKNVASEMIDSHHNDGVAKHIRQLLAADKE